MDVGRQRHVAERIDQDVHVVLRVVGPQADPAAAEELPLQNLRHQHPRRPLEPHERTRLQLLTRVHQRGPDLAMTFRLGCMALATQQ